METNFCRQILRQFEPEMAISERDAAGHEEYLAPVWNVVSLIRNATKFILPYTGRPLDDKQFKALDENEPLRLPFPVIALEYFADLSTPHDPKNRSSKRVVLAREQSDSIVLTPVIWIDSDKSWGVLPECALPNTGYLDRTRITNGNVAINVGLSDARIPSSDYEDELGALLCFLNALQCSNVDIEKVPRKKEKAKVKGALPFDFYHVLTIASGKAGEQQGVGGVAGDRRSPREHLRRGHIRRLESGKKVWVNAAVIAAGSAGRVDKSYKVS